MERHIYNDLKKWKDSPKPLIQNVTKRKSNYSAVVRMV